MLRIWIFRWHAASFVVPLLLVGLAWRCWPGIDSLLARMTRRPAPPPAAAPIYRSAPTIERLRPLAELVSLQVQVTDILTVHQDGWLNGYQGAWLIAGDALWTTDLQQARLTEITAASGRPTVRIELPQPRVQWARLDHERTRTYDLRSKSWIPLRGVPPGVQDEALRRAQQLVDRTARHEQHQREAERQAEDTLARFLAAEGYQCEVVWQATATTAEAPGR